MKKNPILTLAAACLLALGAAAGWWWCRFLDPRPSQEDYDAAMRALRTSAQASERLADFRQLAEDTLNRREEEVLAWHGRYCAQAEEITAAWVQGDIIPVSRAGELILEFEAGVAEEWGC